MDKRILYVGCLLILALFLSNRQRLSKRHEFQNWKSKFGIKYESSLQEMYRLRIFQNNLLEIEAHNADRSQTYVMGLNQFSDLTPSQFKQTYLTTIIPPPFINIQSRNDPSQPIQSILMGDIDWVTQGAVTPIKNQGKCGSCWAFSTTGGLQGLSKISDGELKSFSEQQLLDCSSSYGNMGCAGGSMMSSYQYVQDVGISLEDGYPYQTAKQDCKINKGEFKISEHHMITKCTDLLNKLVNQPISVAVDAANWSKYASGVFNNCRKSLDHGVLLVGVKDGNWVIKNSWGTTWGENGYIRLASGNTCGLCNVASYPKR